MKRKILTPIIAIIAITLSIVGMSAFEAHIINVTATIENALSVDTTPIEFGTVFPQEEIDEEINIFLSDSFLAENRVDDINYVIRQKPKCMLKEVVDIGQKIDVSEAITVFMPPYGLVTEDGQGNFICEDGVNYEKLPVLCPFLSKHEVTQEEVENDSEGINAFHGPLTDWNLQDTIDTQVSGRLAKSESDISDTWNIDFRVPCFSGQCAQDWEEFVLSNNPVANPEDYILDGDLEHALFGCDLWIEVTEVSESNTVDLLEQDCIDSGGTVSTSMCCGAVGDFPNLCATGACGCAPESSHEVNICICGEGSCFNGQTCVQIGGDPICGNGIMESGEECDDGVDNKDLVQIEWALTQGDALLSFCTTGCEAREIQGPWCGDQTINGPEECEVDQDCVDSYGAGYTCGDCQCQAPGCDNIIYGYKYDTSQNAIEGWVISLLDHDLASTTAVTYTDVNGYYEFTGLCVDGHYGVYEGLLPGWTFSSPSSGHYYDAYINTQYDFINKPPIAYAGDIVINEIMPNPDVVSDTLGEWFEVYNTTGSSIDLDGCVISDDDTESLTIIGSLVVPASGYAVLGRDSNTGSNGGVTVDYVYSGFALANSGDEIIITCNFLEIDRVEYDSVGWPFDAGVAMGLSDPSLNNNNAINWCAQTSTFGVGDKGTPGSLNDTCVSTEVINFSDMGASPQYGYYHDYSNASVSFTFDTPSNNMSGTVAASGLKPYATYQVKFEGKPSCAGGSDDQGNEDIGYLGRWWDNTDSDNGSDSDYESGDGHCYVGYLVWDYITADASGNASKTVTANNSYHVLWCDSAKSCGDSNSNTSLAQPDASHPTINFCGGGDVYGEIERSTCSGMSMLSGDYDLKMILTEESFHQSPGSWTSVMNTNINFSIN